GYGVDQLTTWLSNDDHRNAIRKDVEKKVRALVVEVAEDLEDILDGHLATVRAAVKAGQKHHVDATKTLSRIAKKLDTEPDDGYGLVCGIEPLEPMEGLAEDGENVQAQDHWRQLCGAVVEQLGHGAGQLYDLTTGDVLDLRESGDREQAAGRLLLNEHMGGVIAEVVSEGARFIAQRNAAQQPAAGKAELTGNLPPLLTTPAVNSVCEILLSATIKEQLVGKVKQAAGQALVADDNGRTKAGPSAVAEKHTAVGSVVDKVLKKELADMLRTGAGQLAELLKTQPYETVKEMGRDLPLQGLGDGVEWLSELVKDLFNPEPGKVRSRVLETLTGQVLKAQDDVIDRALDWLAAEVPETVEGEPAAVANRDKLLNLLVARVDPLVAPAVSGASVEVVQRSKQAVESEQLVAAILPFLRGQLDQGEVFKRLAGYGVDQLTASVRKHREAIRQDVKTQARTLMADVAKDLEGILEGHLETLRSAVAAGQRQKVDGVTTLQLIAEELEPKEKPGDVAVKGMNKMTADSKKPRDQWRDVRQITADQVGEMAGDLIKLTIDETKQLEVAKLILSDSLGEVMRVVVKEGAKFVAKHNGIQHGSAQSNGLVLPSEAVSKMTGTVSPFLTTFVVESVGQKLLSAAWQKQTVCEVKKAAEKALALEYPGKAKARTSVENQQVVHNADLGQRTLIGGEADEILKKGLAEMLRTGADQLEAVLKGLPYDCVKEMVSDLTLQGIADGTRWLDVLATGLFSDNEVVVPRVIDAITKQAVATQQAVIDGVLGWLSTEDKKTQQKPNRQKLLDILVYRMKALVKPAVAGASSLVAESVKQPSESQALRDSVLPFLKGQLNRGQVVERLAGYSVDQLSDWIRQHREVISKDVEVNVRAMMQKMAPELKSILHKRLAMLRSTVQQSPQNKRDAVATLRRAAEEIAPLQVMSAATKKSSKSDQSKATGGLPSLIPSLGVGFSAVIKQITNTVCTNKSALDNIDFVVQEIVTQVVGAGAEYVVHQNAEPSDGNVKHIGEAVTGYVKHLTSGSLSTLAKYAIRQVASYVNNNEGKIGDLIGSTLIQKLNGDMDELDLASLLTPHINDAIDLALNRGKSIIQEEISKWIAANASGSTPELHKAVDEILTHIMANGGEWIVRHQNGIELEIIEPIRIKITETLNNAQAEIIQNVAAWLSNEVNLNYLVSTFTNEIHTAVTNVVVAAAAKQISGKESGPEFRRAVNGITPYVTPIIDQALRQIITYTVKSLSDWVQHHYKDKDKDKSEDISSLVNHFIDKTVQDVMPLVSDAVQKKAAVLAQKEAQKIDFNKLAAELAVAFVNRFDPDTLTSGALKVEPKSRVARELPKILCFLMQTAEAYECLGGDLTEPVEIDRIEIDGRVFKNIKAHLIKMKDGSIQVRKMDFVFEDADKVDIDIEMTGVSISYQLPEKSKLYKAALLSAAPMMSSADLARYLLDTMMPEKVDFNIDQITGEFHDDVLDGPGEDTVSFGLSDIKFSLRLHKYYPKPYMDISVGPKDGHKAIESIKVKVAGQGVVDHVEADINVDRHRNGFADVKALVEPARLNRFSGWLIGGAIKVEAKAAINNGIGTLDDIESIRVHAPRFGGICNALLKNTIKAFNPGFTLGDDGKAVIKLKLALFSEERSNPVTRWLAKAANRILQFFTKPIEVRVSFKGAPYRPVLKGEKGVGSFSGIRFIDGLFNPCPLSIQSDIHDELLRDLRTVSIDKNPQGHLNQLGKIMDQVIEEFRLGNAPSDLNLVREIPLESLALLVNHVKENGGRQEDCARLLFLVANLVEALPEKAVQLVNRSGFTPESSGQPYLLHLISTTPTDFWLVDPKNGTVMEPVYQSHRFKCLQEFWNNSQSNPDGSIYSPDSKKEPVQEITEKAVEEVRTLVSKMNMPDPIKLMMAKDFDFRHKMFNPVIPNQQDLMTSTPVSQDPYRLQRVTPVDAKQHLDWQKPRFVIPEGVEMVGGPPAA
ncbi:hypothetical protein GV64_22010, partial [Endozoicomonas elysicola]